jgi:hypothetical protein
VEKCVCNVRARVLGTPGCARDQEEDVTEQKQEGGGEAGERRVGSLEAGGGAGVAATAISGEARLGQTADDVARVGGGQREVGEGGGGAGKGTWMGAERR